MYYQGIGVKQDYKAFKWFWQAEGEGHPEAQKYLDKLTKLNLISVN
jgi:TPR repeat protein